MPERILLTQLRRIGDVMMTTPAVAAVRAAHPDARIAYLTEAPSHQLFRYSPHVDEVLLLPRGRPLREMLGFLAHLRRRRFDVMVDFFGNPRSALLTRLSGAPRRIGFDFRGRRYAYTERIALAGRGAYSADHKAALVEPLGAWPRELRPQLFLSEAERTYARRQLQALGVDPGDLLVALCPVSRRSFRTWPVERFAHLADVLIERYAARVLLIWGPGEEDFADAMRLHMRQAALPDFSMPSLLQLAGLLEQAHLFVGNDGGPRHMAVALGTPTLTVYGKDFPGVWTPPEQTLHRSVEHDPGCKSACHYPRCGEECINSLAYSTVESAVESYLEELLRDGRPHRRQPAHAPA